MKPWLWLPPSWAHNLSQIYLKSYGHIFSAPIPKWKSFSWRGLQFPNRLGIAGGVDKNGEYLKSFWALGCGFLEIGTITPLPQEPNPGKILDRDVIAMSVWNKMGFPGKGASYVHHQLSQIKQRPTPLFINIGKNRATPNEDAASDYLLGLKKFKDIADAFVINISSPNTKGLRQIQGADSLAKFLRPLLGIQPRPVLLKLSPDLSDSELESTLKTSHELGIDGWVLGNTTTSMTAEGGTSGKPLAPLAKHQLLMTTKFLGAGRGDKLIISVGGVLTPEDVAERLTMGADLVEVYAALVLEGPKFFKRTANYFNI